MNCFILSYVRDSLELAGIILREEKIWVRESVLM